MRCAVQRAICGTAGPTLLQSATRWGELGGPRTPKRISAGICFGLWGIYVLMSILQAEGVIKS